MSFDAWYAIGMTQLVGMGAFVLVSVGALDNHQLSKLSNDEQLVLCLAGFTLAGVLLVLALPTLACLVFYKLPGWSTRLARALRRGTASLYRRRFPAKIQLPVARVVEKR